MNKNDAELLEIEEKPVFSSGASGAEAELLDWLHNGTMPEPPYTQADQLVDALHPRNGGYDLEDCNQSRRVWLLATQRLQKRLIEFAAITFPEPEEVTADDFLSAWQSINANTKRQAEALETLQT